MTDIDINAKLQGFLNAAIEKFIAQNYDDAIRDLKAAEVIDRNNPEILYNLGVSYTRLGLYKTASSYFERLLSLPVSFVDSQVIRKLNCFVLIKMGEYDRAEKFIDDAISFSPSDIAAHSMKGFCLEKKGNYSEAMNAYRTILDLDGENSNARNSLAHILVVTGGDLREAMVQARQAHESDPHNAAYCDTLALVHMKRGERKEALVLLEKALQIQPFSEEIRRHYYDLTGKSPTANK